MGNARLIPIVSILASMLIFSGCGEPEETTTPTSVTTTTPATTTPATTTPATTTPATTTPATTTPATTTPAQDEPQDGGVTEAQAVYIWEQDTQINNKGWVAWHGYEDNDREIFLYKGSGEPIRLTDNNYHDYVSQINDNGQVVWQGHDGNDHEIFLQKESGERIQLTDNGYDHQFPQLNDQGQVVWQGYDGKDYEIFLHKESGERIQLTNNDQDDHAPQINNQGWIVWHGHDGNDSEIFLHRGSGEPLQLTDNDYDDYFPQLNEKGWVVWEGHDGNDHEIFLYKGSGEPIQLTDNDNDDYAPQLNEKGWVVWHGYDGHDSEIFVHKGSGEPIQITNNLNDDYAPQLDQEGWVVWYGQDGNDHEIFKYEGPGKIIQLSDNDYDDYEPRINNEGQVAWAAQNGMVHEIWLASSPAELVWSSSVNQVSTTVHYITFNQPIDLVLPGDVEYGLLYLEAKGGDGGRRYYKSDWGLFTINDHYADGGQGATVSGTFEVGDKPGMIPPGSTIRFIIGEKGGSDNNAGNAGSGGGGGTGILFKAPGAGNGEWQHLIIAGGGGGAHSDCCLERHPGKPGEATDDSLCVDGSGGYEDVGGIAGGSAGGGGYANDGEGVDGGGMTKVGGKAGWPNYDSDRANPGPTGGDGGQYGTHGGWGYGGGGHSVGDLMGGGGGGGACGGDGGNPAHPAGGGGQSMINQTFVSEKLPRQKGGTVRSPQHGYAKYRLLKLTFKQVFVTSTTHNGNLGGFAGADTSCNNRASAAGLTGTFKAWLGSKDTGPVDNFAIDPSVMYTLVNGEWVGMWSNLVEHDLLNPISVTEFGDSVTGKVWTDVYAGAGEPFHQMDAHYACAERKVPWTGKSGGYRGVFGNASQTDVNFTYDQTQIHWPCNAQYRLYCFEQ